MSNLIEFDLTGLDRRRAAKRQQAKARLNGQAPVSELPPGQIAEVIEHEPPRFKTYTTADLLALPRDFEWLVKGMLEIPTFGPIGGKQKTLKSYVNTFIDVGIAAGVPIFGQFEVPEAKTVLSYVGEGGRRPYTNRLERICRSMGVKLKDLPLITSFDVAPIGSEKFQHSLASDLEEYLPGKVSIDPLYGYHDPNVASGDLNQRGPMLAKMSHPVVEAEAVLTVADHMSKTGTGTALERMTQAGMGEWAQTWVMLSHRETPDVENGSFRLFMEIGSREWGGSNWELDIELGWFDPEMGQHIGDIDWDLRPTTADTVAAGRVNRRGDSGQIDYEYEIKNILAEHPWELSQEQIMARFKNNKNARAAFLRLKVGANPVVIVRPVKRPEGGVLKTRNLWANAEEPRPETGVAVDPEGYVD